MIKISTTVYFSSCVLLSY